MESIETTAATVEEAIALGMEELGVESPSQVMVEVLQEPDQGLMGQGARPARVRLVFMGTRGNQATTSIVSDPRESEAVTSIVTRPVPVEEPPSPPVRFQSPQAPQRTEKEVPPEEADEDARVGKEVLDELLSKMDIDGRVTILLAESTRADENTHWILNVVGQKMNRLIGRRGETLSALQYITRLIVSRRLQRRANLIVDAGGYKSRRSDRLKQLANRMADQAVRQKRTITLEPMPPHERRIIHLTLRNRHDVSTKSIGEGSSRKVTISPAN